ncbi:MAG: peptidoglycan-binding protein [Christensenellaceae bacterium]|nr:peptidoglycan-binding protein [Christensenellaceae bacterium]
MPYRQRKRKRSLIDRLSDFFKALGRNIKNLLNRLLPRRKPGQPVFTSRRFIAACAAAVIVAAAVLVPVLVTAGKSEKTSSDNDGLELAALRFDPQPAPEPIDLSAGSKGEQVYELQQRLMELGYLAADEMIAQDMSEEDIELLSSEPDEEEVEPESAEPDGEGILLEEEPLFQSISPEECEFDENMHQAITRFQILVGEKPTGRVDNALWEKIFAPDAPVCVLAPGMEGDDIKEFQIRLRDLNYISAEPTGIFDDVTAEAVKLFQEKNSISQSGNIDVDTQEMLYSEDVIANYLSYGQRSDEVADMQTKLISLGYLSGTADGVYGNQTLAAVKLFQKKNDLIVDGYLGYQSKQLLMSGGAEPNAFGIGDEGTEVERLQNRLVKLKYINKATGYFGSDTDLAVKNFQKLNNLAVDGKAGPKTLAVLYSDSAVKAKTTIKVGQNDKVDKFINAAASKLGKKYILGAKGPNAFDCSGLVYWALKQAGVKQSYVTSVTWRKVGNYKTIKDIDDVRKGDIICFSPHHVGIAINSNTMIDASTSNGKVVKRSFKTNYWRKHFVCARRVF